MKVLLGDAVTSPRVTPGTWRDVGPTGWLAARIVGYALGSEPPALFLTLGRARRLFRGWLHFAATLMPGGTLPRRETELVILRIAHLRDCAYEFDHHTRLGRRAGLSSADIGRILDGPDAADWTPRERVLLRAVDMLHADRDLTDDVWTALRWHLDEAGAIQFLMLVGHYDMLATVINTLRIEPDAPR
jgi:AhpD family alkylhydroperoxidase